MYLLRAFNFVCKLCFEGEVAVVGGTREQEGEGVHEGEPEGEEEGGGDRAGGEKS